MGALSTSPNWIVEDDVLLKNAVETGASLESLAKGAVCFSRRFTLRELQDRWYSLLYDSETSAQASARIIEYEIELSTSNLAKANKLFNSKKDFSFQKRKIDSIRNQYYAMRKRVCNEPCNSADLGYVVAPCSCIASGRECVCGALLEPSQDHLVQNIASGTNMLNCYGHPGGSYNGGQHVYPDINAHHSFRTKHVGVVESEDTMQFERLAAGNQYGNEVTESKPLLDSDQDGDKHDSFTGNNNVKLQEPGSLRAIDQHECSQEPGVPIWSTIQDVNAPDMLTDMHIKEKEQEILTLADNKKMNTVNCDALALQANLDGGISDSGLDNPTMSESDFMDFQLMDFTNSEEFELLNSENFLNSPHETNQDDAGDPDTKVVLEESSTVPNLLHTNKTNMCCDQIDRNHDKHNVMDASGVNLIPTSEVSYPGRNVECKLNTEDPDIPCNDDIVIPGQPPLECPTSIWDQNSQNNICSVTPATTPTSNAGNSNIGDLALVKEENVGNVQPSSQPMKLNLSTLEQKERMVAFNNGCIVGAKPSEGPSIGGVLAHDSIDASSTNSCISALHSINGAEFGEESPCGLRQHESFYKSQNLTMEKSILVADHVNYNSLNIPSGCKPEIGTETALQNCVSSHALSDLELQDPISAMSTSDQEEQVSDNENDVPNYFDLEALILDQDLVPCDQESDFIHPEVSRFQYLESRKVLIRLEQGAQSYMNRAIMSRDAFAILYGQHLKYYIKDPEVFLGRETEDIKVDIDLGKEGRANKISRRQAIIKMDEGGSFHINNIGKCSIFVNSKEVPSNNRINLSTDSLIEIRDMRFIFHVNQDAVRQHIIHTMRGSSQSQNARFDWVLSQPMN